MFFTVFDVEIFVKNVRFLFSHYRILWGINFLCFTEMSRMFQLLISMGERICYVFLKLLCTFTKYLSIVCRSCWILGEKNSCFKSEKLDKDSVWDKKRASRILNVPSTLHGESRQTVQLKIKITWWKGLSTSKTEICSYAN